PGAPAIVHSVQHPDDRDRGDARRNPGRADAAPEPPARRCPASVRGPERLEETLVVDDRTLRDPYRIAQRSKPPRQVLLGAHIGRDRGRGRALGAQPFTLFDLHRLAARVAYDELLDRPPSHPHTSLTRRSGASPSSMSASRLASSARARCRRDRTVPIGQPRTAAHSAYESSAISQSATASRYSTGRLRIAA